MTQEYEWSNEKSKARAGYRGSRTCRGGAPQVPCAAQQHRKIIVVLASRLVRVHRRDVTKNRAERGVLIAAALRKECTKVGSVSEFLDSPVVNSGAARDGTHHFRAGFLGRPLVNHSAVRPGHLDIRHRIVPHQRELERPDGVDQHTLNVVQILGGHTAVGQHAPNGAVVTVRPLPRGDVVVELELQLRNVVPPTIKVHLDQAGDVAPAQRSGFREAVLDLRDVKLALDLLEPFFQRGGSRVLERKPCNVADAVEPPGSVLKIDLFLDPRRALDARVVRSRRNPARGSPARARVEGCGAIFARCARIRTHIRRSPRGPRQHRRLEHLLRRCCVTKELIQVGRGLQNVVGRRGVGGSGVGHQRSAAQPLRVDVGERVVPDEGPRALGRGVVLPKGLDDGVSDGGNFRQDVAAKNRGNNGAPHRRGVPTLERSEEQSEERVLGRLDVQRFRIAVKRAPPRVVGVVHLHVHADIAADERPARFPLVVSGRELAGNLGEPILGSGAPPWVCQKVLQRPVHKGVLSVARPFDAESAKLTEVPHRKVQPRHDEPHGLVPESAAPLSVGTHPSSSDLDATGFHLVEERVSPSRVGVACRERGA
eukprot:m.246794 g.246794  ORF g.246794 m.246794 type:complete len:596 (+) comp26438_c0_seq1:568-2355(+)